MKLKACLIILLFIAVSSCKKPKEIEIPNPLPASDSFMPLAIGNYWKYNEDNHTQILDTVRIKGELYYHVYSMIGGDAVSIQYLRIDQDQTLISGSPGLPDFKAIVAKFNANVGDSFQAIGDQGYNDFKITVIEKSANKMTFSYDRIYHPNLKGQPFTRTFLKGFGWDDRYKEIRINGSVYKR